MLFSVIVPVYKSEKYLRECADSILAQSFGDLELILVDDGSPDGCPAICDEYASSDGRVHVIHKENGGVTSARKAGACAARGDYIVCIDSDDTVSPEYLSKFSVAASEHGVDIVCCGMVKEYSNRTVEKPVKSRSGLFTRADMEREIFPRLIEDAYADAFTSNVCAKAIRRELFATAQSDVDDGIRIGEDAACITLCIFAAQSMYTIDECLYYYRCYNESATGTAKPRNWDEAKLVAECYERYMDLSTFDLREQWYSNIAHVFFNVCASHLNGAEPYKQVRKKIKLLLKSEFYNRAVKRAKFKCKSGKLMVFALKHKFIRLIKLYATRNSDQ